MRIEFDSKFFSPADTFTVHTVPVDQTGVIFDFTRQEYIFCNRHVRDQTIFLKYCADAKLLCLVNITDLNFFATQINTARLGMIDTGENLHQSGFSSTVFAQQTMYFAFLNAEGYIIQSTDTGKCFCYMFETDDGFRPQCFRHAFHHLLVHVRV